jgi:putative flippase GtrA
MTDLTPRPSPTPARRQREERAYRLVVAGGSAAVVTVVTLVLAVLGIIGFGIPVLAAIVTVLCAILFRRTVAP